MPINRLRAYDLVNSDFAQVLGFCTGDLPRIFDAINRAQERLIYAKEAAEEGWAGGWAEMAFGVNPKCPYLTTPRGVARLEAIDGCNRPIPLYSQFYEYLEYGNGRMPKTDRWIGRCANWRQAGYARNYTPTFTDISNPPQQIQIFAVNPTDTLPNPQTGAIPRVFVQGLDQNGNIVTSQDGPNIVQGEFITLAQPYAFSVNTYSTLTGLQKDQTLGEVQIWQSDPIWGNGEILSVMEPTELTGWYRRYYLNGLPHGCCPTFRPIIVNKQPDTCGCPYERKEWVMVTALAKLDLIPVQALTDYCLIQSKESMIAEAQSIRMSKMDDAGSRAQSTEYHAEAVRLLSGEVKHKEGKNTVAVSFAPFGRYGWGHTRIGMI